MNRKIAIAVAALMLGAGPVWAQSVGVPAASPTLLECRETENLWNEQNGVKLGEVSVYHEVALYTLNGDGTYVRQVEGSGSIHSTFISTPKSYILAIDKEAASKDIITDIFLLEIDRINQSVRGDEVFHMVGSSVFVHVTFTGPCTALHLTPKF